MSARQLLVVLAGLGLLGATACGRPNAGQDKQPTGPESHNDGTCNGNSDCESGICVGGHCTSGDCTDDHDCTGSEFCWFEDLTEWDPGTAGNCTAACGNDGDCSAGQDCVDGRCYSQIDCNPANNNNDCPPAEVCDESTRVCTVPPDQCTWADECPVGWICNIDNTCVDPDDLDLGDCDTNSDCNSVTGCTGGACTCEDGSCRPRSGCTTAEDCGAGNYCASNVCRPAVHCPSGQDNCTPYGLVCEDGYCVNPEPCSATGTCPTGYTCITSYNPDACFPEGTNECVRDDQCPSTQYCELFSGTCEVGCRTNADCAGDCGAAATSCNCNNDHECSSGSGGDVGDDCSDNSECPGGTICSFNDPMSGLACDLFPIGDCSKSCRIVCDLLVSQIIDTCPAGQSCGGDDTIMAAIRQLFGAFMSSESASVCY
jgi:hypothetical protein